MTEITDTKEPTKLHPAIDRFILHWGEMGSQWGVNRSVSQIHALLYVSDRPMTAEAIAETLGIARSNVSNSIKELLAWDLIRRVPVRGDRREHFEAEADIWELVARIAAGRKAREIDPALAVLRSCMSDIESGGTIDPVAAKRLKEMLSFTEAVDAWYAQMMKVPKTKLAGLLRLGAKIIKFVPGSKAKKP